MTELFNEGRMKSGTFKDKIAYIGIKVLRI